MRELFFDALAERPSIARALWEQTVETMRPFRRFLTQAIHTAKERQTRYELPWERVQGEVEVELVPIDTALRIPAPPRGYLLTGCPRDFVPRLEEPLVLVNRKGLNVHVLAVEPRGDALRIETDQPLAESDLIFWDSHACKAASEGAPSPPSSIQHEHGKRLDILYSEAAEGDVFRVIVEGTVEEGAALRVDGREIAARVDEPFDPDLKLDDKRGRTYRAPSRTLRTEDPPEGELRGSNRLRFRAQLRKGERRQGPWVELLPPEHVDSEDLIDPRAAFCESDIEEVWTDRRHRKEAIYKVKRIDRERYQLLLDRYPPKDTHLFLPVDVHSLRLQRRAAYQLADEPLPHHRGLVRLCEDPRAMRWPSVQAVSIERWYSLTDPTRSGTEEQRRFVAKALGTVDIAVLEGPPGSGKTTAICEIIQQLVARGQRVLLCASTHVAIDNVLERLLDGEVSIDAVRVGKLERVDEKVQRCQIDRRVEELMDAWQRRPELAARGDGELREMAERTIVLGADLTCGTTMGILRHPLLAERREQDERERPVSSYPYFDVLLVDEASKTLIQEFLVPALLARRHIIVGDVHQLPPFADRADLVANLGSLIDDRDRPIFSQDHQRACLLLHRIGRRDLRGTGLRWLIVEPGAVLDGLARELAKDKELAEIEVVRVVRRAQRESAGGGARRTSQDSAGAVREVSLVEIQRGDLSAIWLAAADWVLVEDALLREAAPHLPANLRMARDLTQRELLAESDALLFRQAWWSAKESDRRLSVWERGHEITSAAELEEHERKWLAGHTWAAEIAWRLTREHELRWSKRGDERQKLGDAIRGLSPRTIDITPSIGDVRDIGLPSILEVLQTGIGADRSRRSSALAEGIPRRHEADWRARFESLSFQHRMHPTISQFSRETFYAHKALLDANTIAERDVKIGWDFEAERGARRVWIDVHGNDRGGVNRDEIDAMRSVLQRFLAWSQEKGLPPRKLPAKWEVACLCFYVKQEQAIREMLASLLHREKPASRHETDLVEIVCGTVDRFQGREADLVILSMRNVKRIGFLDSPNRLNVAVTRARQQLFVMGKAEYFERCRVGELESLASKTVKMTAIRLKGGGR